WMKFREELLNRYFPAAKKARKRAEFDKLTSSPGMTVTKYSAKFHALDRFAPIVMAERTEMMRKFTDGLPSCIRTLVIATNPQDFER
ncbi:hypothetical protein M569_00023, partial [Genlisea aurea]